MANNLICSTRRFRTADPSKAEVEAALHKGGSLRNAAAILGIGVTPRLYRLIYQYSIEYNPTGGRKKKQISQDNIQLALDRSRTLTEAAEILGISVPTLSRRVKQYRLTYKTEYKQSQDFWRRGLSRLKDPLLRALFRVALRKTCSCVDVADAAGISPRTLARISEGIAPSMANFLALAGAVGYREVLEAALEEDPR